MKLTFRTCHHNPLVCVPIGLLHRPIRGHHLSQEVNVPKKVIIELWDPIFRCSHPIVSLSVSTLLSRFSYGRVGMCWRRPSNASLILWKLTQDYEIILMKYVNNWFKLLNFCPFLRVLSFFLIIALLTCIRLRSRMFAACRCCTWRFFLISLFSLSLFCLTTRKLQFRDNF